MTPLRAGISLLLVGLVCLTVVVLRAERRRHEAVAETYLTRLVDHRRQMWNMQMELARLRTPEQIRERVARMDLALGDDFVPEGAPTHLRRYADGHR